MQAARYPQIHVGTSSPNPLALVAAVRLELRRRGVGSQEIRRFSDEAMVAAQDGRRVRRVCRAWVTTLGP